MTAGISATASKAYVRALVDGGLIAPAGYGKGFPLLRSWGLDIMRRLVAEFITSIGDGQPVLSNHLPLLIPAHQYDAEVATFGGFEATYRGSIGELRFVLRPDSAVNNLSALHDSVRQHGPDQIVSVFQGFRDVHGATTPLFRDRFICPFVQFNRLVDVSRRDECVRGLWATLTAYFDALGLPVRIVDFGPWKNYARTLYAAVAHLPEGEPTIVAMMYVVGDAFRELAGLPDHLEALDIGITEKVLAMLVLRHTNASGLRLPSTAAPFEVGVSDEAGESVEPLVARQLGAVRWRRTGPQTRKSVSAWRRRGLPLQLLRGRAGLRLHSRSGDWLDVTPDLDLRRLLGAQDLELGRCAAAEDIANATPPILALPADLSSASAASVVHLSPLLIEQAGGCPVNPYWGGDRVFY